MYFVCENKRVIEANIHMTQAYQFKKTADEVCRERNARQGSTHREWDDKTKPVPVHSVQGFYLVPEALYDEILKRWVEE
jgi:hypothetical protein